MTKRRIRKAAAALMLSAAMLLTLASPLAQPITVSRALSLEELEQQRDELKQQAAQLQQQKDNLSNSIEDQKQRISYIEQQIEYKQREIDLSRQLIEAVEAQIAEKDEEIRAAEKKIEEASEASNERFAQLQDRLRNISKTGNFSALQMLLSTDDYVDYLLKSKIMQQIATSDEKLIEELEEEVAHINKQREELNEAKSRLEDQRASLLLIKAEADAAKAEMDALHYEVRVLINSLQSDLNYYTNLLDKVKEDEAELEATIDRVLAELNGGSMQLSGKMYWPSKSCTIVTCTYGGRYLEGAYNFHKGIDIACYGSAHGKDIVAAADGEVIYTNTWDSWGGGYGYYLMIDHGYDVYGRRIVTLYAHCSRILVSEGDRVTGGVTQIAEIGNTGWSYGAHLHFEVRVDGQHEDPLTNGWLSY